jgi:hypothetical protein
MIVVISVLKNVFKVLASYFKSEKISGQWKICCGFIISALALELLMFTLMVLTIALEFYNISIQ